MTVLRTRQLTLRPVAAADAQRIADLTSDYDVSKMLAVVPYPNPPANVLAWIATHGGPDGEVAFVARADGELAAVCGYKPKPDGSVGHFGYWVGKPYWGRGYATEMTRALIKHAFVNTGTDGIPIDHFADNPQSARVIAKCGFRYERLGKIQCVARGCEVQTLHYRLTRAQAEAQPWYAAA